MIRSMFTAISSLTLHQKYLDVVASNLANANTNGYKSSRVLFQDQYSQMLSGGSAPTDTLGGTNPAQIGLGVSIGYITGNFSQGTLQNTARNLDLAIQGDGFFVYGSDENRAYSREGSMSLDSEGFLVNMATGLRTQGWLASTEGIIDTNSAISDIQVDTSKTIAKVTENVLMGGNLKADTLNSDPVTVTIGVYDSLGAPQTVTIKFTHQEEAAAIPAILDDPLTLLVDESAPAVPAVGPNEWVWLITDGGSGTGTISFDADGKLPATVPVEVDITGSAGATTPFPVELDFTKLTQFTTSTSTISATSQDGLPANSVSQVYVSPKTGDVSLVYSNGMVETIGQIALAKFANPNGLNRSENTTFTAGLNSGLPQIGAGGSGGMGNISAGSLEASNVDMAQEFTNLILAQRGFQANSRVITTSDEILQELVNLKR